MSRGLFITFEGSDGAGKSTQIQLAKEYLESIGIEPIMTREPGGTSISEKLRDILLDKENSEMSPIAEMMIYASARAQLVAEVIRPAIERGETVVCDRYIDSSIAYQGYGRGLGDIVEEVNRVAIDGVMPDITFFLDLDPAVGRSRIRSDEMDRLEQEKLDFHYRVYNGYKKVAEADPKRVAVIDASRTIEEISLEIRTILKEVCDRKGL
ncbi:MAG: dTMP kinase [Clostridiales bacterium]|nr:dTMP kinase [Candidatus Crickella merdequi]